jgi:DNA ligase-1
MEALAQLTDGAEPALREPGSLYAFNRSSTLRKLKRFFDEEALVIGHDPGAGRHKGRHGALKCRDKTGTEINVGTGFSDAERDAPPPVGATITFRFQERTESGTPRFPSFVAVRDYE